MGGHEDRNTEEVKGSSGNSSGRLILPAEPVGHGQRQDKGLTQRTKGHTLKGNTADLENYKISRWEWGGG